MFDARSAIHLSTSSTPDGSPAVRVPTTDASPPEGGDAAGGHGWAQRLRRAGRWAGHFVGVVAALGLLQLGGLHVERLLPDSALRVPPGSAFALALIFVALRGLWRDASPRRVELPAFALIAIAMGALAFNVGVVAPHDPGFVAVTRLFGPAPGSIGAPSCFLLLGLSMLLLTVEGRAAREASQFLSIAAGGIVLVALLGLIFRFVRVEVALPSLGISLLVALGLLAASFSTLVLPRASRLLELIERDSPGAVVVRRLVPMAIALPLAVVWMEAVGERLGWFESRQSAGVLTLVTIVAVVALILWMSSRLDELNLSRYQAERLADTQRRWLQATLANIGEAVVTVDDQLRVSFMNDAAEALLGLRASQAEGQPVASLLPLVDGPSGTELECPVREAFDEARPVSLPGEPAIRRPDGTLQAVEVTATPIKDDGLSVIGGVLVLRDVSANRARAHAEREAYAALDRRVAERTRALDRTMSVLRESTTLLATIAASTPELIVAKSRDGRIMMVNPAALQSMGLSRAQVMGRKEEELFGASDEILRAVDNDRRVIETGRPVVVEERRTLQSDTRTYLVTKSPLRDAEGQVFGLVGVAKDITERKRAQQDLEQLLVAEHRLRGEAERANRAKDEFLAIVSHELRSPLNALKGWSQVLQGARNPDPGLIGRAAEAIKRNIDHQTRLIDDLLDTSRIISGKLELHVHRINVVDVVSASLDQSWDGARAKRIQLSFACEDDEVYVDGDFDRLQQVLSNLLSNAIKFTPEGGTIQVRLLKTDRCVELSVADSGIGIDANFLPHVFDRFSQADTSMTRRYMGLGIGLALVRNLVELHDGTVQATSAGAGKGSVFTVILPRAKGKGARRSARREGGGSGDAGLAGVTAYVVDDDPDAREVMRLILGNAGADVRLFAGPEELLALWQSQEEIPPRSVVLLDIAMPGDSGFELLRRMRAVEHRPPVPAIAATALTHLEDEEFRQAGFHGKVGKPVETAMLLRMISSALNSAEQRTAGEPEA